jgi:hypothetical protein
VSDSAYINDLETRISELERELAAANGLVEKHRNALQWLANGKTGLSSETILFTSLGIKHKQYHPWDAGDRERCVELLRECPWAMEGFERLCHDCGQWAINEKFIRLKLNRATADTARKKETE